MLSAAQVQAYDELGVVAPLRLLDADAVARYVAACERVRAQVGMRARIDELHRHFGWAQALATEPRLLDAVADLIGDEILIHAVLLLCKYPGRPGKVPWHQDSFYSGWHRSRTVSAWIALSPSTVENGCMRVVEGSQRWGAREHDERPGPENMLWGGLTLRERVDEARVRDLVLDVGELSLHHSNVVHGSEANRGQDVRVGFIVRYVTPEYRETRGPVLRARGSAEVEHLDLLDWLPGWDGAVAGIDREVEDWRAGGGEGQFTNG